MYKVSYEKRAVFTTIKKGKQPRRTGVGERICVLLNKPTRSLNPYSTLSKVVPQLAEGYDYCLAYTTRTPYMLNDRSLSFFDEPSNQEILQRCLGDYKMEYRYNSKVLLFFKKKNLSWARLDWELIQKFPHNHHIKNGFVYHS